jgi:hypothetical protein
MSSTAATEQERHDVTTVSSSVGLLVYLLSAGVFTYGVVVSDHHHQEEEEETAAGAAVPDDPSWFYRIMTYYIFIFLPVVFITEIHALIILSFLHWCASQHLVGKVVGPPTTSWSRQVGQEHDEEFCQVEYRAPAERTTTTIVDGGGDVGHQILDDNSKESRNDKNNNNNNAGASSTPTLVYSFGWSRTNFVRHWKEGDDDDDDDDDEQQLLQCPNGDKNNNNLVMDLLMVRGHPGSARPCVRCCGGLFLVPAYTPLSYCRGCHPFLWNAFFLIMYGWFFCWIYGGLPYSYYFLWSRPSLFSLPMALLHGTALMGAAVYLWPSSMYHHRPKATTTAEGSPVVVVVRRDDDDDCGSYVAPKEDRL